MRYSIIIPVYNEEASIKRTLTHVIDCFVSCNDADASLQQTVQEQEQSNGYGQAKVNPIDFEVLVVDSESRDATRAIVDDMSRKYRHIRYMRTDESGRAAQMNYGARAASGAMLMFVHADTKIVGPVEELQAVGSDNDWGFCSLGFDDPSLRFKVLGWFIRTRSRLTRVCTGDQTFVVRRAFFNLHNGFPRQRLMEDVAVSKVFRRHAKPHIYDIESITSARKWQKEGFIKTILLMWLLRLRYTFGAKPEALYKQYYKR